MVNLRFKSEEIKSSLMSFTTIAITLLILLVIAIFLLVSQVKTIQDLRIRAAEFFNQAQ